MTSSYGVSQPNNSNIFYEILSRKGYFICRPYPSSLVEAALSACLRWHSSLLASENQARAPLCSDSTFFSLAIANGFRRIVKSIYPDCMLNQQNLLLVPEALDGHKDQSRWHRDLPYQTWIPQQLAVFNALLCLGLDPAKRYHSLDIFEGSHHCLSFPEYMPRDQIARVELRRGDVLFMNSFLFHRAPIMTNDTFYLLNTVFMPRCFKQQVELSRYLPSSFDSNNSFEQKNLCAYLGLADKPREPTKLC